MALQAAYHREGVQPIGRSLSLRPKTLTCDQTAMRRYGLQFHGLHLW